VANAVAINGLSRRKWWGAGCKQALRVSNITAAGTDIYLNLIV
jgi:hypothetical protein